jgi:hypothetical protein
MKMEYGEFPGELEKHHKENTERTRKIGSSALFSENGDSMFLQNFGTHLCASQTTRTTQTQIVCVTCKFGEKCRRSCELRWNLCYGNEWTAEYISVWNSNWWPLEYEIWGLIKVYFNCFFAVRLLNKPANILPRLKFWTVSMSYLRSSNKFST